MPLKICEVLAEAENTLRVAGIPEYKNDAWLLFEAVFQMNRTGYLMHMSEKLESIPDAEMLYEKYREVTEKRSRHIPLQHITGHQVFMGLDFEVNENVLIPRQDTEILVEEALKLCRENTQIVQVLDMCTGSGCIAVSMKKLAEHEICVTAVDLSAAALETAKRNAAKNDCEIRFLESNLFENTGTQKYDLILSNPPYIRSDVIPTLMEEVKDHEPWMALDGEKDGLFFYRRITQEAEKYLNPGGYLMYETGYDQAEAVEEILQEHGFGKIRIVKDLAGLNRVAAGQKQ